MARTDSASIVAALNNGKMTPMSKPRFPENANFVVCCPHGDWSGFLTWEECSKQFPSLEAKGRPDGYFWVEER